MAQINSNNRQNPPNQCVTDEDARQQDAQLSSFFKKGAPGVNLLLFITFVVKMFHHKHTLLSWCFLVSLFISGGLNFYFGMRSTRRNQPPLVKWVKRLERRCNVAYASTFLRMTAAAALLLFFDDVYVVVVVPLFLMVIALLAFLFLDAAELGQVEGASYYWDNEHHMRALNLLFDLSAQAVSMGFSGLSGAVLGYVKSSSDIASGYRSPECLMLYGIVLALLVVLFSSIPPMVHHPDTRINIVKVYMPIVAYAALLFLVLAFVMAAQEIIQEYVFFAFFITAAVAVLCFWKEHWYGPGNQTGEGSGVDLKLSQYLLDFYYSSAFMALMASYSTYVTSDGKEAFSWLFKGFVLSAVCSIVTYVSRMVVVFAEAQGMGSLLFPKMAWSVATYATAAMTVLFAILVFLLHPDELTSIF